MLAIELILGDGSKIVSSTCYRMGTLGIPNYHEIVNALQVLLRKKRLKKFFLEGDLNLSSTDWVTNLSTHSIEQIFLDEFIRLGLLQCISTPTHIKNNILDIVLTNSDSYIRNIKILSDHEACKSDHYAITFEIKFRIERKKPLKTKSFNFKRANWDQLNNDLNNIDWISFLDCHEPDLAWFKFKQLLNYFLEIHIPKITVKHNSGPPWFDADCYIKCREKERLHKKYKRTKSMSDELKFVNCRREFKNLIKSKMRDNLYCSNDRNTITKKFWAHVKSKSKSNRIPEVVRHKDSISYNNLNKANMFNKYFYDQFPNTSTYDIDIDFSNDPKFDIDFSCTRVKQFLDAINTNKAPGPDGIHGCVLKYCSRSLCRPLSIVFKLSYNIGVIPSEWKSANIVPVHKRGDKNLVSNYRPISLICLSAKIMENIIHEELLIKTRDLINAEQHGLLSGKSCTTNLLTLCDDVARCLYNDKCIDIIYFDFAKGFDTVNHDLLLLKLKNEFNIDARLLKFFVNYLQNRHQCVVLKNVLSDTLPVMSGVPQGSILGPLLFVLFINDISTRISNGTSICLFADDTKIWRGMSSVEDCNILQNDIDYLHDWCISNQMKFHPNKCKVVSINSKSSSTHLAYLGLLPLSRFNHTLGRNILDYETEEKDLGVIVNNNFSWAEQHNQIINKASQMLGLLKRTCHFVISNHRKRTLYLAMVRSQFEHCSQIWRPVTPTQISKFECLQKNAIKWILNEEFISYSDNEIYLKKCRDINILPINKKFDLNDILLFHKIINGYVHIGLPEYVSKFIGLSRLREKHLDSECYICNLYHPSISARSPIFKNYFCRVTYLWNKLSYEARLNPNTNTFKAQVVVVYITMTTAHLDMTFKITKTIS